MAQKRSRPQRPRAQRAAASAASYTAGGFLGRLLVMAAVVAAIVFGIAIFMKINTVEVQGNTIYSYENVLQASGIEQGDNLLTLNRAATVGRIQAALPYVETVSVGRSLPDTVVIRITESESVFCVDAEDGGFWLINTRGKAMERIEAEAAEDYPRIAGISLVKPESGQMAVASDTQALQAALSVLEQMDGTGLLDRIRQMDVSRQFDISLQYDDRFTVLLGGTEEMEYKIRYLTAILEQLSDYQAGTIDLTDCMDGKAEFRAAG